MNAGTLKLIRNHPATVIAGLSLLAVLGFALVNRLVNRFAEQQKALARHLYEQALLAQNSGQMDRAIERLRAALMYSHENFQYQLSLARVLRDTGRTSEAETYLVSLWERSPQDAAVNLALARLAVYQHLPDRAVQYYHNAIYGVWASDADANRLNAWFELIDFLLQQNLRPLAQAELITIASELPPNPDLLIRLANRFARAQDYEHAFAEYVRVLQVDQRNAAALAGAGQAAFNLGHHGTAERYLQSALEVNPNDTKSAQLLRLSTLILQSDPYSRAITSSERDRRIRAAFTQAGERLNSCSQTKGTDLNAPSISPLSPLKTQWLATKPQLQHLRSDPGLTDTIMDLVFQIEQQTKAECGTPSGVDEALLMLAQNRFGAER